MQKQKNLFRLVEGALMIAVAAVLSLVKVLELPYGGSVTACSALPILLVAYRHGTGWGLFTGFTFSLIQLLLGLSNVSYMTTPLSVMAVIMLDYVVAFMVLGLGGVFRSPARSQGKALVWGALLTGLLRYVCHVIAGCTVWAGLSIPTKAAFLYSLAYNATYMIPEILVTALGAWYLSRVLDLREQIPARAPAAQPMNRPAFVLSLLSKATLAVTAVWDVVLVFGCLQDGETGEFVLSGLANVPWTMVAVVTVVGVVLWLLLDAVRRRCMRQV
ncbi:MAG: energy-coupled thiamine transporter ThiT [Clostridia bacterium]|nr:energy-coupled thiamine transporter ThiT [Clostridia bacterium]